MTTSTNVKGLTHKTSTCLRARERSLVAREQFSLPEGPGWQSL